MTNACVAVLTFGLLDHLAALASSSQLTCQPYLTFSLTTLISVLRRLSQPPELRTRSLLISISVAVTMITVTRRLRARAPADLVRLRATPPHRRADVTPLHRRADVTKRRIASQRLLWEALGMLVCLNDAARAWARADGRLQLRRRRRVAGILCAHGVAHPRCATRAGSLEWLGA